MFKNLLITSALLLIVILIKINKSDGNVQQLCSNKKSGNTCHCKRKTDTETNFPITIADCVRINLDNFPENSQLPNDLNLLDLSFNKIEKLANQFVSETLEIIKISYNNITEITTEFFDGFPNLRELDLSHNRIGSLGNSPRIFSNLPNLLSLDLSFNKLTDLPSNNLFGAVVNLKFIDFSYNNLGESLTKSPDTLQNELGLPIGITHLKLDQIGLKQIHNTYFDGYDNLLYLSLADNDLVTIPTIPYSVEYLDLSGNDFKFLQAKYLNYHSLKTLKLNRLKQLEEIHKYAFYNLQSIEEISINDCGNLMEFNEFVFGLLHKNENSPLKKLSLARNSLKTLNFTYKYLIEQLEVVDLRNNPWRCDCDLLWMMNGELEVINNLRCTTPRNLRNKLIKNVNDEDLPECYPEKYGKRFHRILLPILIILIICLAVLVAYLIFYGPEWYGNRRIGPESPYSPTRLEED